MSAEQLTTEIFFFNMESREKGKRRCEGSGGGLVFYFLVESRGKGGGDVEVRFGLRRRPASEREREGRRWRWRSALVDDDGRENLRRWLMAQEDGRKDGREKPKRLIPC
ncbi:hypothetical protein IHE45_18G024300 [Dioscorea alata]|uniref:Uncharacterized protein n=1 Tax=Dioscorea alata TaxID=55571 RepID=A0ACB7U5N1_DIOAL|nr:hypothetical protein IHE45_18G024300 [Dioscorea alata]